MQIAKGCLQRNKRLLASADDTTLIALPGFLNVQTQL